MKMPFECSVTLNCCWSSPNSIFSLSKVAFIWSSCTCSSNYHYKHLSFSYAIHNFDGFCYIIIWLFIMGFFTPPSWSGYCLLSLSGSTVLPPNCLTFKRWPIRSVDVIYIKDFATWSMTFVSLSLLEIIFVFWNQLVNFKDHIHLSLIIVKRPWDLFLKVCLWS